MAFRIEYSPEVEGQLRGLTAAQRTLVMSAIGEQLAHQPLVETRNRKPMRPNLLARWELRVRNLRVYYVVEEEPEPVVWIRAVGVKIRDQVWIGGKEAEFQ